MRNLFISIIFLVMSNNVFGISLLHPTAHIGASYTIHDLTYKLMSKITDNKSTRYLVSIPFTFGVGILYKLIEDKGTLKYTKPQSILYNNIGISLSIISIEFNE